MLFYVCAAIVIFLNLLDIYGFAVNFFNNEFKQHNMSSILDSMVSLACIISLVFFTRSYLRKKSKSSNGEKESSSKGNETDPS